MLVKIGSVAAQRFISLNRPDRDIDLVGPHDELVAYLSGLQPVEQYPLGADKLFARTRDGQIHEGEIAWTGSTGAGLIELAKADPGSDYYRHRGFEWIRPSLDLLYTLKMSHRYLRNSPHFRKTMSDIHVMRKAGARLRPEFNDWYMARMAETYAYSHPNLKRTKAEFFSGDTIEYIYDHDSLHEAVKHGPTPAYQLFQVDGQEVLSSRERFEALPESIKQDAVLEETYVLALERSQIPFPQMDPRKSFDIALEKVCTSITSGWFREYAWENHAAIDARYDAGYTRKLHNGISAGVVRLAKKDT